MQHQYLIYCENCQKQFFSVQYAVVLMLPIQNNKKLRKRKQNDGTGNKKILSFYNTNVMI